MQYSSEAEAEKEKWGSNMLSFMNSVTLKLLLFGTQEENISEEENINAEMLFDGMEANMIAAGRIRTKEVRKQTTRTQRVEICSGLVEKKNQLQEKVKTSFNVCRHISRLSCLLPSHSL